MNKIYDLVIIGAGPAGLTASIYASRYKVNNLVIGSQFESYAFKAHKICNFPTEMEITGPDLIKKIYDHAQTLGGEIIMDNVLRIESAAGETGNYKITTQNKGEFLARAIIIASGSKHCNLGLSNEEEFIGKGVSYCASCDAMFFKNKVVAVVGGSDSANTTSLYLAKIAQKVYQIYRKEKLRGEVAWIDQISQTPNIEVIYNSNVVELIGDKKLEKIVLDQEFNGSNELKVDGFFIAIGCVPDKALFEKLGVASDEKGYIKVGRDQKTNIAGIWAAGDVTDGSNNFRQIITACAEGAVAAQDIYTWLQAQKK